MTLPEGLPEGQGPDATGGAGETPEAPAPAPDAAAAAPADQAKAASAPAKPAAERPARPAKEVEPKEAPRVAPPPGSINEVLASAAAVRLTAAYMVPEMKGECVTIEVARDDIPAVMTAARDDERLDLKYLRCLSGVDWQDEGLEVVYHLWSFTKKHSLQVKTRVTYDDPSVPSIATI